jgi:hypothetical protein
MPTLFLHHINDSTKIRFNEIDFLLAATHPLLSICVMPVTPVTPDEEQDELISVTSIAKDT